MGKSKNKKEQLPENDNNNVAFYKKRREDDKMGENIEVESKPETTPTTETSHI